MLHSIIFFCCMFKVCQCNIIKPKFSVFFVQLKEWIRRSLNASIEVCFFDVRLLISSLVFQLCLLFTNVHCLYGFLLVSCLMIGLFIVGFTHQDLESSSSESCRH
ncbi:hypothetical protein GLYMA_15G012400v4 [Glycine max]|nr:hypothetical protein GLYMA_15G012400v4 [Glycine max]